MPNDARPTRVYLVNVPLDYRIRRVRVRAVEKGRVLVVRDPWEGNERKLYPLDYKHCWFKTFAAAKAYAVRFWREHRRALLVDARRARAALVATRKMEKTDA